MTGVSGEAARVLVIDDDPIVADSLAAFFESEGMRSLAVYSGDEAMTAMDEASDGQTGAFEVVLCDINLPGRGGLELLGEITRKHRSSAVIMLTGYGTVESAVEALRLGAIDYLTKPVVDDELRIALRRALHHQALKRENAMLRDRIEGSFGLDGVVGQDPRMRRIFEVVRAVAASRTTVLMSGESGVGKSLIAGAIHQASPRKDKPYVELSCGSIPETLLESELFGHVKGAFTGAHADKAGRFLAADGGTLFLDEINSASPGMQLKLLRVLQERKFEPVGSNETVEVDVRVVLASNQSLEDLVADGRFRQDLYYRINVVKIEVPPLRDRESDIRMLAERFLDEQSEQLGRAFGGFSPEAMAALRRYTYPGNVRELANIIERAAVLSRGQTITIDDLPPQVVDSDHRPLPSRPGAELDLIGDSAWQPQTLAEAMIEPERGFILRSLEANGWNRTATADQLGINRTTLYKKMRSLGIDPEDHAKAG
ncbi:MAG: sigma-54 dependent transcriptional regulator [Planctomycetota bacterium]